ncbi:MAG: roadblock/LC7 domain-containing protein [Candidatus Korarchaeota archaeon]
MSRQEIDALKGVLEQLKQSMPKDSVFLITTVEGLPVVSLGLDELEEAKVSAMASAVLTLGERAAEELQRGEMEEVYIEGEKGRFLLTAAGPRYILGVSVPIDLKPGLVRLNMKSAADKIREITGS